MELKKEMLRGTPLSEKDFKAGKVLSVSWDPDLQYEWDNGVGIGYYLASLREGVIAGCRCEKCDTITVPPRGFCEYCFTPINEYVDLKDTGTINTFSISHVDWKASRLKKGERYHTPAIIEIDGASPGHGILHMIDGCDPEDIKIGQKVKAVWRKPEDRTGSITDILYFKLMRKPASKKRKKK
jgi:hypothetical protein